MIFMSKDSSLDRDQGPTKVKMDDMLRKASRSGLALMKTATPDTPGAHGCWLGGQPTLSPTICWPSYTDKGLDLAVPMHFLAQINLSSIPRTAESQHLPEDGTLFFFYDTVRAPVDHFVDGGSQVIYVSGDVSQFAAREMPAIPDIKESFMKSNWYAQRQTNGYLRWNIDILEYDGVYARCFEDHTFFSSAVEETNKIEQRFTNQMHRQARRRSDPNAKIAKEFVWHHMFGAPIGDAQESGLVRLLALSDDPDINFEHAGDWIVFEITRQNLKEQNFQKTCLHEELR